MINYGLDLGFQAMADLFWFFVKLTIQLVRGIVTLRRQHAEWNGEGQ